MIKHEEDEIQVLGVPAKNKKTVGKKRTIGYIILVIMGIIGIACCWWLWWNPTDTEDSKTVSYKESNIPMLMKNGQETTTHKTNTKISILADTVNDVPMQIFMLEGVHSNLCMGLPSVQDTTVLMALPAADIRKDNLGIVGDFVLDGCRYGNGKRKEGYCALLQGQLFLGVSISDTIMNYCVDRQGSFFRQYALVNDNKIWPNRLKGKSLRRAVAKKKDDARIYVVISRQRESLYDFSEALSDYGMHDAIYLPGGDAYAFYRANGEVSFLGISQEHVYPNTNYLVFSK